MRRHANKKKSDNIAKKAGQKYDPLRNSSNDPNISSLQGRPEHEAV